MPEKPGDTGTEGSGPPPYEEGESLRPDKLLSVNEPWTEVDSMTYGVKLDGYYITAEVSELEVTDVTSVEEVAKDV